MIREMIAEREILEKALESTKSNFTRIDVDYRQLCNEAKVRSGELSQLRGTINVSWFLIDMRFRFASLLVWKGKG